MNTTLQADENGALHVPPSLLPDPAPLATYSIEEHHGQIVIAKKREDQNGTPFWARASAEARVAALRNWLQQVQTPAGLSDYAVSRDSIYD